MSVPNVVVTSQPSERIAVVSINRPERRNAIDDNVRQRLLDCLASALNEPSIRAVILTGEGGTFCAGGDLTTLAGLDVQAARARLQSGHKVVRLLVNADKPVIAAVEGFAMGAGAGLALCADTIVLGQSATIGFPFLKVGLIPDFGVTYSVARRIGVARARNALLYARNYRGQEALDIGLADVLVPDPDVRSRAIELAGELAALPRHALGMTKRQLAQSPADLETSLEMEALGQPFCLSTAEFAEGFAAFKEKRRPAF